MVIGARWWHWILSIDLCLIAVTVINPYLPSLGTNPLVSGRGGWRILEPFNLVRENNPAAWWSGVCLFTAGLLAVELYVKKAEKLAWPWLVLSVIFIGLSCDEIMSIHERLSGWHVMIPLAAGGAIVLLTALLKLLGRPETRKSALIIGGCFFIFGLVAVIEYFEHNLHWPTWIRGLRTGVEEGLELIAIFFLLCVLVRHRPSKEGMGLRAVVPRMDTFKRLPLFLVAGLIAHLLVSCFWAPDLHDLDKRGQPAAWYPSALFFLLFCCAFWKSMEGAVRFRIRWRILSALFLLGSVDILTVSFRYVLIVFPGIVDQIPGYWFDGFLNLGYLLHLLLLVLLVSRLGGFRFITWLAFTAGFLLLLAWGLLFESSLLHFILGGIIALGELLFFLSFAPGDGSTNLARERFLVDD